MESKTKWFDQIRYVLRLKHRRISTEDAYVPWVKRFILFGKLSVPRDRRDSAVIGVPEVWRYDGQHMVI